MYIQALGIGLILVYSSHGSSAMKSSFSSCVPCSKICKPLTTDKQAFRMYMISRPFIIMYIYSLYKCQPSNHRVEWRLIIIIITAKLLLTACATCSRTMYMYKVLLNKIDSY